MRVGGRASVIFQALGLEDFQRQIGDSGFLQVKSSRARVGVGASKTT